MSFEGAIARLHQVKMDYNSVQSWSTELQNAPNTQVLIKTSDELANSINRLFEANPDTAPEVWLSRLTPESGEELTYFEILVNFFLAYLSCLATLNERQALPEAKKHEAVGLIQKLPEVFYQQLTQKLVIYPHIYLLALELLRS